MRRTPIAVLLGLSLAVTAMVRLDLDPRLVTRLDAATRNVVSTIVDSVRQHGLPTEPIIQRALEGSAKGGSGVAIIAAVRRYAEYIRQAGEALGPGATDDEIAAGASALQAGVPVRQLQRLRKVQPGQRYAMALGVLTFIARQSVPPDTAADVVIGLVLASASDEQLTALQNDVMRDINGGTPAGLAATTRGLWLGNVLAEAKANDGGARGAGLPSVRGSTRSADPAANGQMGSKVNATTSGDGSPPAAPRGRPKKP